MTYVIRKMSSTKMAKLHFLKNQMLVMFPKISHFKMLAFRNAGIH